MTKRGNKKSKRRQCDSLNEFSSESNSTEMPKRPKIWRNLPKADKMELETLFNKKFTYRNRVASDHKSWIRNLVSRLRGIESSSSVWQDENLMTLKRDVNSLKDQLSGKDIESWHNHTTECNYAGKIIPYVKSLGVELCTQAWVKFYEIVNAFNIVPDQSFISVHLCEAPGAFIAALNHHLQQTEFPYAWDWCATTLNPYHESNSLSEMIADDRLIRYTHRKWFFGLDGSGDIKAENHIEGLITKLRAMETAMDAKVYLVTADGSKDCQENPGEQESLLSELHYCEMLAGCLMLAPGGCLVLKIFTMFEASTIGLMALLNVLFQTVNTFKPATSKSGNSEMYVVCVGYLANMERENLWSMLKAVRDSSFTHFVGFDELSHEFLREHRDFCHKFAALQSDTIKRNMRFFDTPPAQYCDQLRQLQESAIDCFVERTKIRGSRSIQRLVPFGREKSAFYTEMPLLSSVNYQPTSKSGESPVVQGPCQHKQLKGTFHLRQNLSALSFEERVGLMDIREAAPPNTILTCRHPVRDQEVELWTASLDTASFPCRVYNSRLCDSSILDDCNFLVQRSEFLEHRKEKCDEHIKQLACLLLKVLGPLITEEQQNQQSSNQQQKQHQQHHQHHHHHHHQQQHRHHHYQQKQHHHHHHQQQQPQQSLHEGAQYQDDCHRIHHHCHPVDTNRRQDKHDKRDQYAQQDDRHYTHHHEDLHDHSHYRDHHPQQQQQQQEQYPPTQQQREKQSVNMPMSDANNYTSPTELSKSSNNGKGSKPEHFHSSQDGRSQSHSEPGPRTRMSPSPQNPCQKKSTPRRYNPNHSPSTEKCSEDKQNLSSWRHGGHSPPTTNARTSSSPGKSRDKHSTTSSGNNNDSDSLSKSKTPPIINPEKRHANFPAAPRRKPSSAMLKLIWVKAGCKGANFSSCFEYFSEETRQSEFKNSIQVELKDWHAAKQDAREQDNCDFNNVVYFVNMTRLLWDDGESSRSVDDEGEDGEEKEATTFSYSSSSCEFEELRTRSFALHQICLILERLPIGSNVVLLTSSFLTRFHSGLLYILARHFHRIHVTSDPNLWLHQAVVCRGFKGMSSPLLLQHLSAIQGSVEETEEVDGRRCCGFVETVKFIHILGDRKFVQFVTAHNNYLLSGFSNMVLDSHRDQPMP